MERSYGTGPRLNYRVHQASFIAGSATLVTIANRAVRYRQEQILKAKKSRLEDHKAYYLNKYKEQL
jgi:hypothetical protein